MLAQIWLLLKTQPKAQNIIVTSVDLLIYDLSFVHKSTSCSAHPIFDRIEVRITIRFIDSSLWVFSH